MRPKIWIMIVALSVLLMMVLSVQPLVAAGPDTNQVEQGQRIIIGLNDAHQIDWLYEMSRRQGLRILRVDEKLRIAVVEIPAITASRMQAQVSENADVRYVETDGRVSMVVSPNDPDYNDPSLVYGPQLMRAPQAWDTSMGDPNIIIGILDTGIDASHPEFSGRILPGYDFVNNDSDPADDHGHGTHVSGIAAAGINNSIGMAGIAGQASLLPIKVLDNTGNGWWSNVATGMIWAVDHGARVINLSLGGTVDSTALRDAVSYATARNVVIVVAAGNNSTDAPFYPAVYDNVMAVGAVTPFGVWASYSNYGPNVDVVAPGSTVYSTEWAGTGRSYGFRSGTSMASPHVAGLAALILSVNPNLSESEVRRLITYNTQAADPQIVDTYLGHGLVDAGAAVAAASPQPPVNTGVIQGIVFYDWNQNSVQDAGEQGTANIQVCLYQDQSPLGVLDGADVQLSCMTTLGDGSYQFTQLADSSYLVVETPPARFVATTPIVYSATISAGLVTASAGVFDFGNLVYSTIAGTIFVDSNGNGVQDAGESTGIANVTTTLTSLDTLQTISTFSDSAGNFNFGSLIPGTYSLKTAASVPGYTPTNTIIQEVTVGIDSSISGLTFGYINPTGNKLVNFTISQAKQGIQLNWVTSSEINQSGFVIWRSLSANGAYKPVSPLILAENNALGAGYQWLDTSVDRYGIYWYKLQSLPDGEFFGPISSEYPFPQPDTTSTLFAPFIVR